MSYDEKRYDPPGEVLFTVEYAPTILVQFLRMRTFATYNEGKLNDVGFDVPNLVPLRGRTPEEEARITDGARERGEGRCNMEPEDCPICRLGYALDAGLVEPVFQWTSS